MANFLKNIYGQNQRSFLMPIICVIFIINIIIVALQIDSSIIFYAFLVLSVVTFGLVLFTIASLRKSGIVIPSLSEMREMKKDLKNKDSDPSDV